MIELMASIGIQLVNAARFVGPTVVAKHMVSTLTTRLLVGQLLGEAEVMYAEHYLPPAIEALQELELSLMYVSPPLAAKVSQLEQQSIELNRSLESGAIMRPITAQLGPAFNITHLVTQITGLHKWVALAEAAVTEVANDRFGIDLKVQVDERRFVKDILEWQIDPAGDIKTLRLAVDYERAGRHRKALQTLEGLLKQYSQYSSFSLEFTKTW
jgi:hypothetical protein